MSKTISIMTDQERAIAENMVGFLDAVAKKNGWMDWLSMKQGEKPAEATVEHNYVSIYGKTRDGAIVRLQFDRHQKRSRLWLLVTLNVNAGPYLSGHTFIEHYGKSFAYYDNSGHDDFISDNLARCWTISSARDVEALMRAYDSLSVIYGRQPLFNL